MGEDEIAQAPAPAPNFPRADQSCVALDTRCVFSFVSLGLFTDRIVFIHPLVLFLSLASLCLSSIFLFALSSFLALTIAPFSSSYSSFFVSPIFLAPLFSAVVPVLYFHVFLFPFLFEESNSIQPFDVSKIRITRICRFV